MTIRKSAILFYAAIITSMLCTYSANAAEAFIGISFQQPVMLALDKDTLEENGKMVRNIIVSPALSIKTSDSYFTENSNWGGYVEFASGFYNVDRQNVDGSIVNISTSLSGQYWNLTPTIFYNFGNKNNDWSFKAGIGIGIGYQSVSGTMIMTGKTGQPAESFSDDGYDYSGGAVFDFTKNNWSLQYKVYGTAINVRDNRMELDNHSFIVGRKIEF